MSTRNGLSLVFALALISQIGCCGPCCMQCGGCDVSCGMPGCGVADPCCGCPSCGVADGCCDSVSCGVADPCCGCPSCGCAEPACGCDVSCGVPNCGSMVCGTGNCPILSRLKNFLCGCNSCGGCAYEPCYDGCNQPMSSCPTCQQSSYNAPVKLQQRRAKLTRGANVADEIRFAREPNANYR